MQVILNLYSSGHDLEPGVVVISCVSDRLVMDLDEPKRKIQLNKEEMRQVLNMFVATERH